MATRSLPVTALPLLLLAGAAAFFLLNKDPVDPATNPEINSPRPKAQSQGKKSNSADASTPSSDKTDTGTGTGNRLETDIDSNSGTGSGTNRWIPLDLNSAPAIDRLPGWEVRRGNFQLTREPDNSHPALELLPEPIVEGKIRCARMMWGGGGIRARMQGEKSRRSHPRFSVGLHQDRELHLRAFPGEHRLELVACDPDLLNESLLAKTDVPDWNYTSGDWIWLELQIIPGSHIPPHAPAPSYGDPAAPSSAIPPLPAPSPLPGDSGSIPSLCEGRVWKNGTPRPEKPQLTHPLPLPPGVFFAAVQGAPFALKPIRIDAAEILTLPPLPSTPSLDPPPK